MNINKIKQILTTLFCMSIACEVNASNNPITPTVNITKVPDYVFGYATYATPIKFKINGCTTARITKIVAKFKWEEHEKTIELTDRFVANDGPSVSNGTSLEYTCFIPSSFHDGVLCADRRSSGTEYFLKVDFVPTTDGVEYDPESLDSVPSQDQVPTSGKVKKAFADETVFCLELPRPGQTENSHTYQLADIGAPETDKDGVGKFYQLNESSTYAGPPAGIPINGLAFGLSYPQEVSNSPMLVGVSEAVAECKTESNGISSSTKFAVATPDEDLWPVTYKATAYGKRKGCYFYISYAGKSVDPLGTNEFAMDLSKSSGQYSVDLFSGSASIIEQGYDSGNNSALGVLSGLAGCGWALSPAGTFTSVGFGLLSSIASLFNSLDNSTDVASINNSADGRLSFGFVMTNDGVGGDGILSAVDNGVSVMVHASNLNGNVGEQYVYFVQAESVCTIKPELRSILMDDQILYSKAAMYTSENDFKDVVLTTKNFNQ